MSVAKNEIPVVIKSTCSRYIVIDEDIHAILTPYSMMLYMAFRYLSDFGKESSQIKRTAKYIYDKAKIKRTQFFASLNELESYGLILRDPNNKAGEVCIFHVAQHLGHFRPIVQMDDQNADHQGGSSQYERGSSQYGYHNHYSLPIIKSIIISDSKESPEVNYENSKAVNDGLGNTSLQMPTELPESVTSQPVANEGNISNAKIIEEIKEAYHEELPDCPKIKVVDTKLVNQLNRMRKNWPKYQKDGNKFTVESFRDYLRCIKEHYPWFIKPYTTANGNVRRNNLRVLTTETNITKIVNGEFSG